jgi:CHAD domain-containing protein
MTTELEAKLIPGEKFRMPALGGMPDGSIAVADRVRELDAIYYDTADLDLARWGVTLRHRRGEAGRPWTLKLPEHASDTTLARDELTFDGPDDTVPAEARDLVRGFTCNHDLQRVARLHTTRVPMHVQDADGRVLIEIVDDSVEIREGTRDVDAFREVEVEATANRPRNRAALRAAVAELLDAGCRVERPVPKLVRALGRRAQQPPTIVVEPVGKHASIAELVRHLTASSAVEILMNDPGVRRGHDPEAVHRYRVATRRLRADLHTFSRFLDDAPTHELLDELRWLGHAIGPVRDLDVLAARFADRAHGLSDPDQPSARELSAQLTASRLEAHQQLLEVLRSDRYDRTLRTLVAFAANPPMGGGAEKPATDLARPFVRRRWKQLAEAVRTAGDDPTDAQLHVIRISAKRCRYAAEALAPVAGRPARRFASAVEEVQTVLGDYHDTVVAEAWLRNAAVELVDHRVAIGGLIAAERRERATLRDVWPEVWHRASKPKLRSWL